MPERETEKWRRVLGNVSMCLLTSQPKFNVIFTFAPLGMIFKMYEDIKWHNAISNLKHFFPIYSYVDSTDETRRLIKRYIIKRLLNVYCEIFGTRSYGGDALASSCLLRHMDSCRIFHNIHSITYKYCTVTPVQSEWEYF